MAASKRPAVRKHDRVTLAPHKSVIPPYDGKPFVLRDTVLTISEITGKGSKRDPWGLRVTDGTHEWHLEPDDVVKIHEEHSTMKRSANRDLNEWLDHNGYRHAHARKKTTPHPYALSTRMAHARMVESPATGREIFAAKERDHHITTHGRQMLRPDQFALPPGPEERRRGIKGRLPIDTISRARNALQRAAQMKKSGHISAAQLATVQRKVHAAWPSIASDS